MTNSKAVVTGAFGYSGKYITDRLLAQNYEVITLTNSPQRYTTYPQGLTVHPYDFENPQRMAEVITGAKVFINTYWMRMESKSQSFEQAIANSKALIHAAQLAQIPRFIHISATNASLTSPAKYYRSKAIVEELIKNSGLSYAILRPAFLFGNEDILINNLAWMLRRLPAYPIFGDGLYKVRPIHVEDLAELVVEQIDKHENQVINAVGPVELTYREFIEAISSAIGVKRWLIPVPVWFGYLGSLVLGWLLNDVITTREELAALVSGTLSAPGEPVGKINLINWLQENAQTLGQRYRNERKRRRILTKPYAEL